jgi:Predicted membrane protein
LFDTAFIGLATAWSYLTDKAGRPGLRSTHEFIQDYVTSMSRKDPTPLESIIEKSATDSPVLTSQLRFQSSDKNDDFRIVLPDIHPGPFHPVGGSNITGLIYNEMDYTANGYA